MKEGSTRPLRLTAIQLQQRLIHVQSENDRLKRELARYQNEYHYDMIDQLRKENERLQELLASTKNQHHEKDKEQTITQTAMTGDQSETIIVHDEEIQEGNFFISQQNRQVQNKMEAKTKRNAVNQPLVEENWFSHNVKDRSNH